MAAAYFLNLFSHSPIRHLQEHMSIVHRCVETLPLFLDVVLCGDWVSAVQYQQQIADLEREADELKRNLRFNLPKSIFMPVSRTDILELLTVQDSLANRARDIAGLVLGRKMQFPKAVALLMQQLFQRSADASLQTKKAINELEEVFETGFCGGELEIMQSMIKELDSIEQDTDQIQVKIREHLFALEKDLPPVDVMFFYKTIEWGGDLADRAHKIGGRLMILLAR